MKNITKITLLNLGTALCIVPVSMAQSVVIEGGPTPVRISNENGILDGSSRGENSEVITAKPTPLIPPPVVPPIGVDSNTSSTVRPEKGTIVVRPTTVTTQSDETRPVNDASTVTGTPTQEVTTQTEREDIDVVRKRARLVRELNIRENIVDSRIILRTKNMFESNTAKINPMANSTLDKITEYLGLSPLNAVRVKYIQEPAGTPDELALSRSMALTKWVKLNGNVGDKSFTFGNPEVRVTTLDDTKPIEDGGEDFGEYIILDLNP
ncbi:MAG: hypothetical protein P1V20_11085 [Verrucomicrobiales bacterium]|nr:hypothetical protein [Verrucomicrobiales bacterium]